MFSKKKHNIAKGRLDETGRALVRSAGLSDQDLENAISEMRYAHVRSRIAAERESRACAGAPASSRQGFTGTHAETVWLGALATARLAVAVMTLVTAATAALSLIALKSAAPSPDEPVRLDAGSVSGACALPLGDCAVSKEDVLIVVVREREPEEQR
jgi:hypothetical protein